MPQRPTIARAIVRELRDVRLRACRDVAVHDSSATRPPSATWIFARRYSSSWLKRSVSGAENVTPSAIAARDDRDLADRIGARREHADQRMAGLVVRGALAVRVREHDLALGAENDPLERIA